MPLHILVVDDDPATLKVLSRLLSRAGHSVDLCESGGEALSRITSSSFDVLLTDMMMPEMTGLDLARAAREIRPELRCMIMSGLLPAPEAVSFAWVPKPFDIPALLASLAA